MTNNQEKVISGQNRPITISLPDCYFDVLETMANLQGRDVQELATERLKQIIGEDVIFSSSEEGFYGQLLADGWKETLKDDPYFKAISGQR